jgi:RNA-directed DNA polymerase
VRANKGAAGIDGMTIDDFPAWAKAGNWKRIMSELRSGQYQPSPVRRVEIDKPDGGKRQLGIPIVVGRLIQQAIDQVLTPIFDPTFSDNSFGFRPRRNGQQAVKQVKDIIKTGRRFAVDVDLSKFFDREEHDLLMTHLGYKVRDKRLLKLIKHYLRAGFFAKKVGITSFIVIVEKVYLKVGHFPFVGKHHAYPLDKELKKRGHQFARYATDLPYW